MNSADRNEATLHPALGIDFGQARIGIACTDILGMLAHPVESIHLKRCEPIARIGELISERGIRTLVLGLPLRLDGSEGSACEKVRQFGNKLQAAQPDFILQYVDEFLTTSVAQDKLHQAGKKSHQFKSIIDQAAAVEILNNWLESIGDANPNETYLDSYSNL